MFLVSKKHYLSGKNSARFAATQVYARNVSGNFWNSAADIEIKSLILLTMYSTRMIFANLIFIILILTTNSAFAGRCTGSSGCTACTTCSSCRYCNSGGSCGVCSGGGFGFGKLLLVGGGAMILYSIFNKKSNK